MRVAGALVGVVLFLAGCQGADASQDNGTAARFAQAKAAAMGGGGAEIVLSPGAEARNVRPDEDVVIRSYRGRLLDVTVQPESGKQLKGTMGKDKMSWRSRRPLETSTTYTVTVNAMGIDGKQVTTTSSFKTVTPRGTVFASMTPLSGATVGVGMPVIVNFSTPVRERSRRAVEKAIKIASNPEVEGAWRWMSSMQVQWRPRNYWPSGTSVSIVRDLRGIEVSPGYWGVAAPKVNFSIGDAMVSTVDVKKHTMTVRRNGVVLRTIPITTGKKGFETRNGIKVIMTKERERRMDAETTGIDKDDPEYYDVTVEYAMRLTGSGEFLHAAPWSVGSQGHENVSHGCTGMSLAQAKWLFSVSTVGDVVRYVGSSRPLEWGNGYTAWEMPFSKWAAG